MVRLAQPKLRARARRRVAAKTTDDARTGTATASERADLARLEARLRVLLARGEGSAWEVGRVFDDVASRGLHHAAGFATLAAYADARFAQGYTTLKRNRRVAMAFTKRTTVRHGVTKLHLGLLYIDATPEHERPAEIPRLEVRVPGRGGQVVAKPFADCSTHELERAIEAALAKPRETDDPATAKAKRVQADLQAAVAAPKGTHQHAPSVRAYPHPDHHGELQFDLRAVDLRDAPRVAKALLTAAKKWVAKLTPAAKPRRRRA